MAEFPPPKTASNTSNSPAQGLPAYRPPAEPEPAASPYEAPSTSPQLTSSGGGAAGGGEVSHGAIQMLIRTRGWVRFLSVLGFLCAIMVLAVAGIGLVIGGLAGEMAQSGGTVGALPNIIAIVFYGLMALLYIHPSLKLWQYASWITRLQHSQTNVDLEMALNKQRGFWKYCGIMMILLIVFYVGLIAFFAATFAAIGSKM